MFEQMVCAQHLCHSTFVLVEETHLENEILLLEELQKCYCRAAHN